MPGAPLSEQQWKHLIRLIEDKHVIPIVGPELVEVVDGGVRMKLEDWLAKELRSYFELEVTSTDGEVERTRPLEAVIRDYRSTNQDLSMLYSRTYRLISDKRFVPSPSLVQLAQMTDFDLYVSCAFDRLLAECLQQERQMAPVELSFTPKRAAKLDYKAFTSPNPIVYYLFGRLTTAQQEYALGDEDRLEWISALQRSESEVGNFFSCLKNGRLLILGVGYQDWFARFMLRATTQRPLSNKEDHGAYISDKVLERERGLVDFLESVKSQSIVVDEQGGAISFVDQLYTRWKARRDARPALATEERHPPAYLPPDDPPEVLLPEPVIEEDEAEKFEEGMVFLSYSRGDSEAVRRLSAMLDDAGIRTWFDRNRLRAGDHFSKDISDAITKCRLFIPLLSNSTATRKEGYFRREWFWAAHRSQSMAASVRFIIPVIIDDSDIMASEPPQAFLERHAESLPGGVPDANFISRLKKIINGKNTGESS